MGLSEDQKALLRLLAQREEGYEDIGALMGLSVTEVRSRVRSALAELEGTEPAPAPPPEEPRPEEPPAPAQEPTPAPPAKPSPEPTPEKPARPAQQAAPRRPSPVKSLGGNRLESLPL